MYILSLNNDDVSNIHLPKPDLKFLYILSLNNHATPIKLAGNHI